MKKNKSAQEMQKLSFQAQKKKFGSNEDYKKEMSRRTSVRWKKKKGVDN